MVEENIVDNVDNNSINTYPHHIHSVQALITVTIYSSLNNRYYIVDISFEVLITLLLILYL
jgi:hypothetical protein